MTELRAFIVDHWFGLVAALFGLVALVWASGLLHPAERPPREPRRPKGPTEMRHTINVAPLDEPPPEPPRDAA